MAENLSRGRGSRRRGFRPGRGVQPPRFALERNPIGSSATVVAVTGELDLYEVPKLDAALDEVEDATPVVVDLAEATFVDSTALGSLVRAHRQLAERGCELLLAVREPQIRKLFEVTGFDRLFRIFPSVDEAAEYVRSAASKTPAPAAS